MKDIFGRELKSGDFVLSGNSSVALIENSCGIVVGENEVWKFAKRDDSREYGRLVKQQNLIYLEVNTVERKEFYDSLLLSYNKYLNSKMKTYSLYENINIGDIVVLDNKSKNKFVYLGYCNYILKNKFLNELDNKSGYLYIKYNALKRYYNSLNKEEGLNLTFKLIARNLPTFLRSDDAIFSDEFLISSSIHESDIEVRGVLKDYIVKTWCSNNVFVEFFGKRELEI